MRDGQDPILLLQSDCKSEVVGVEKWTLNEKQFLLWVFIYTGGIDTTLVTRLRHIWQIIRWGTPWTDFAELDPDKARQLAKWILDNFPEDKSDGQESKNLSA